MMARCFVIQPFSPEFDQLYDRVFAPAIRDAGMEPYRVDTEPHVSVPVENIEAGIKASEACLADISTNNPNVWYELGFAIAHGKPVVIVCSEEREDDLPFDVQQRNIMHYCRAPYDLRSLRENVTTRLRDVCGERERVSYLAGVDRHTEIGGLRGAEAAALISIASNSVTGDANIHPSQVRHDLEPAGFDDTAIALAMEGLRRRELVCEVRTRDARNVEYTAFCLTKQGKSWLQQHQDEIAAVKEAA
jgi:hypothetical protein